ncbi:MAG: photosystem I assembly BtpA [Parcubacteria group bacterium Gr01-1014_38]|nr:MAG: photosystem I assembly BtpA [Parcubacteria group bacterium Gr01-1014_38]
MIHIFEGDEQAQLAQALEDLERLHDYVAGVIVENYDCGYLDANRATPEICDRLLRITKEIVRRSKVPVGVNVLPNDYEQSLRIAHMTNARFIQVDHVTGKFIGCESVDPQHLLSVRATRPHVAVLGGIHPKYYDLFDPNTPLAASAHAAKGLADAIVVTGEYTGGETNLNDVRTVKEVVPDHPVIVGSGITIQNVHAQLRIADGAIVGTAFKKEGVIPGEPIDADLVRRLMDEVAKIR